MRNTQTRRFIARLKRHGPNAAFKASLVTCMIISRDRKRFLYHACQSCEGFEVFGCSPATAYKNLCNEFLPHDNRKINKKQKMELMEVDDEGNYINENSSVVHESYWENRMPLSGSFCEETHECGKD